MQQGQMKCRKFGIRSPVWSIGLTRFNAPNPLLTWRGNRRMLRFATNSLHFVTNANNYLQHNGSPCWLPPNDVSLRQILRLGRLLNKPLDVLFDLLRMAGRFVRVFMP